MVTQAFLTGFGFLSGRSSTSVAGIIYSVHSLWHLDVWHQDLAVFAFLLFFFCCCFSVLTGAFAPVWHANNGKQSAASV